MIDNDKAYSTHEEQVYEYWPDLPDEHDDISDEKLVNKRRAYRRVMNKRKFKKRKNISLNMGYRPSVGWPNWKRVDGEIIEEGKYMKYPNGSNRQKFAKHQSNKRVRKSNDICGKGNVYRRQFDYKWDVW